MGTVAPTNRYDLFLDTLKQGSLSISTFVSTINSALGEDYQKNTREVLSFTQEALALLKVQGQEAGELAAWLWFWRSWALHVSSSFSLAVEGAKKAQELFHARGDRRSECRAMNALMVNELYLGHVDDSVGWSGEAEQLAEELGDEQLLKTILVNTAKVHIKIGSFDEAYDILLRAILLPVASGGAEIPIMIAQGECYAHYQQDLESQKTFTKALEKSLELGYNSFAAEIHLNLGIAAVKNAKKESAERHFAEAWRFASGHDERDMLARILHHQGIMEETLGKPNLAIIHYQKALDLCMAVGNVLLARDIHKSMATALEPLDPRSALNHYKTYHEIEVRIFSQRSTKAMEQERRKRARAEAESYRVLYSQIATISSIGQEITASLDLDDILETLQREIHQLMPADTFGLALYDQEKRELDYSFFVERGKRLPTVHVPVDTGTTLGAWCMRTGQTIFTADITKEWPEFLDFQPVFPPEDIKKSLIFIPLMSKGLKLGVLSVQSSEIGVFSSFHLDTLRALASYITIALDNARLFKAVQYRATYDILTGVLNRPSIFDRGEDSFLRLKRYGGKLSALMVDLDHFKKINDTHGHLQGDKVIQEVAKELTKHLRDCDYLGRYGGEEFLAILPETDGHGAMVLADRIRLSMAGKVIRVPKGDGIKCTLSIGIHEFTHEDEDFESGIQMADEALYWCKEHGRNQIKGSWEKKSN